MKRLKTNLNGLIKISLICLVLFMLSPSLKVQAMFSDTAIANMGIKLELGTVKLAAKDTKIFDAVNFTEGNPVTIASSKLIIDGTLSGKLAYKVNITKENGSALTAEELKETSVLINFGTIAKEVTASSASLNTNSFIFAKDDNDHDVVIEPDSTSEVPIAINYKNNISTKDEKIKISVTFRLIQSNAINANDQLFSDEEIIENTVKLTTKVVEPEKDWPAQNTFEKSSDGKFSYSFKKNNILFSETSETFNTNKRQIRNLNKAVLYIQFPASEELITTFKKNGKEETINTFDIPYISTGDTAIKVDKVELDKEHHGIKITFKLEDSYSYNLAKPNDSLYHANKDKYSLTLDFDIKKYSDSKNGYDYYSGFHTYDQFFATRLVLSSDLVLPINGAYTKYAQLPIKLTKDNVNLTFKRFNTTNPESADLTNFKDVQFNAKDIGIEVQGVKDGQVASLLNPDKTFSLWLKSNETWNKAFLNVKITGDTGNTLIISRELINEIKSQSINMKSMKVPLVEENTSQQIDAKITEEEPSSPVESSLPSESIIETPVEEATEEKVIEKTKEVEEGVDSSVVESAAELKEKTVTIKEELNESATEAKQEMNN